MTSTSVTATRDTAGVQLVPARCRIARGMPAASPAHQVVGEPSGPRAPSADEWSRPILLESSLMLIDPGEHSVETFTAPGRKDHWTLADLVNALYLWEAPSFDYERAASPRSTPEWLVGLAQVESPAGPAFEVVWRRERANAPEPPPKDDAALAEVSLTRRASLSNTLLAMTSRAADRRRKEPKPTSPLALRPPRRSSWKLRL
jgi:hypothetical protein